MGQYFEFHNKTKNTTNGPISINGGLPWFPKLNYYEYDEIIDIFNHIINENKWNLNDEIHAYGDEGDVIKYKNQKLI